MDSGIYNKALLPDIAAYPAAFQHPTRDTGTDMVVQTQRRNLVRQWAQAVMDRDGKARAIRFDTLEKICQALDCQPGDILAYEKEG